MKTTNKILLLAFVAVAMVFASCSKDDNDNVPTQQEIEAKIIGKWKWTGCEGKDVVTNMRVVYSFFAGGQATCSLSAFDPITTQYVWENQKPVRYSITNNKLYETAENLEIYSTINAISDSQLALVEDKVISHGVSQKEKYSMDFTKVTADYSKEIIGLWEGVELIGEETYGNAEARIEYHADGTYTYFKNYLGRWCPSENVDNEYNVDGDWLATRWRPEEGADFNYEWWDIDEIKDGTMTWSALRENEKGERYTTTFTWKKIDAPTEEQYKSMILGEWICYEYDYYRFKNGEMVDSVIKKYQGKQTYTFNPDNTYSANHIEPDGTMLWEEYGSYEMNGSVMTMILEKLIIEGEPFDLGEPETYVYGIHYIDKENISQVQYSKYIVPATGEVVYDLTESKLRRP